MIYKKLHSNRGETMVEMLVSIALLVLAMSILGAMLSVSYNITNAVREADDKYYEDLSAAEQHGSEAHDGEVTISCVGGGSVKIDVDIYGSGDGDSALKTYCKKKP